MKGIIIYKGKYSATRQYAGWLGETLHLPAVMSDNIDEDNLSQYDFFVIGSSVYAGRLVLNSWLKSNLPFLRKKKIFLFIVCATPSDKKDMLDSIIRANIPEEIRNHCEIFFLPGRVIKKELSRTDRFVLRLGAWLAKPGDRERMLKDFDAVRKENIIPLVNAVLLSDPGKKDINIIVGNAV